MTAMFSNQISNSSFISTVCISMITNIARYFYLICKRLKHDFLIFWNRNKYFLFQLSHYRTGTFMLIDFKNEFDTGDIYITKSETIFFLCCYADGNKWYYNEWIIFLMRHKTSHWSYLYFCNKELSNYQIAAVIFMPVARLFFTLLKLYSKDIKYCVRIFFTSWLIFSCNRIFLRRMWN